MTDQIYEKYWSYTAAYTDLNSDKALSTLRTMVGFINAHADEDFTEEKYARLQQLLVETTGIQDISVRKAINQYVKLGFVRPRLEGYPPETEAYLAARTDRKRSSLLSKIVYKYAKFDNSITEISETRQINFLIKTLEEVGSLSTMQLGAMMTVDVDTIAKGFLTADELQEHCTMAENRKFSNRKYNQIYHLLNLTGKLDDLVVHDGTLFFKTDAERLFGDAIDARKTVRDPYLQRVYKRELEAESMEYYHSQTPRCMLEGLSHPVLIASHIKPYKDSNEHEEFDADNGLLLSKNIDSLFDLGYMTFTDDGTAVAAKDLTDEMKQYVAQFRLAPGFINEKRLAYMQFHRANVFEKRYAPRTFAS